ncbi:hypothetical protein TTSV1_gp13 [Thermoproteus tenax spherical virus 1]|uniref:Uncharacterized protein n=1 Tax=Thermoproteus tenax spherical virus 1 TaxID=292639 RepID=Q647E9_9VIRU|nr:hypothetical protein TTSV1_gp13 [Thermoproteus tenax spherical virus 1]AAU25963.1 hypothetical protein [Thermoproteus tenax spherical virus 1]
MRWLLILALAAVLLAVWAYNVSHPPQPKVVVVGPSTNTATQTSPPQQQQPQSQPVMACQGTLIQSGPIRACNVVSYYGNMIVLQSPGWITGQFAISAISGQCVFKTVDGVLSIAGAGCQVTILYNGTS